MNDTTTLTPQTGVAQMSPCCRGRALHADLDGTWYVGRQNRAYRSRDAGRSWSWLTTLPSSTKWRIAGLTRLTARLMRAEVRALLPLPGGGLVAANREGVYHLPPGETRMRPSDMAAGSTPPWPPMTLTLGPDERVVWSEYGGNPDRRSVRIFASDDGGRTFAEAFAFKPGEIRHVHNLYYDAGLDKYWVLAGDHDQEPGIGLMSAELSDLQWVVKGDQAYRAVCLFDFGDRIVYGTDTEMAPNAVISLDKATGKTRRVAETDGSCIYACRFGEVYAITTSVEPSPVNPCRDAKLLVSRDGEDWREVYTAPKDRWNENYFQFGSIVLPRGASDSETILLSGQAVRGIDDRVLTCRWGDLS